MKRLRSASTFSADAFVPSEVFTHKGDAVALQNLAHAFRICAVAVEHSEIKPAEACADFREMLAVSAVSAEKNPVFRGNKGKARPKGLVPGQ